MNTRINICKNLLHGLSYRLLKYLQFIISDIHICQKTIEL